MRTYVELLSSPGELAELLKIFKPMMHTVKLVTGHSKHYHSAQRLTVLFREICNDIIDQVCVVIVVCMCVSLLLSIRPPALPLPSLAASCYLLLVSPSPSLPSRPVGNGLPQPRGHLQGGTR